MNEKGKLQKVMELPDDQRRMVIRRECQGYAEKFVKLQAGQMQRLLTLADYANPYLTMKPAFEGAVIEDFAELVEQGLVYRALKPVHWSSANSTALAEAELEYEDRQDLSVYVDFEAADREAVEKAFGAELDCTPSFTIWTTTPWTLPANLAIAVHPDYRYAVVEVDGNLAIMASDLVAKVTKLAGSEKVRIVAEADGAKLLGLKYRHPFCEREGRVVAADYVTLEDGTGPQGRPRNLLPGARRWHLRRHRAGMAARQERLGRQQGGHRAPPPERPPVPRPRLHALVPARLAFQDAGDLPCHRAVVHRRRPRHQA